MDKDKLNDAINNLSMRLKKPHLGLEEENIRSSSINDSAGFSSKKVPVFQKFIPSEKFQIFTKEDHILKLQKKSFELDQLNKSNQSKIKELKEFIELKNEIAIKQKQLDIMNQSIKSIQQDYS
ncbi:hypothetical protein KGF54_000718 [Candida jiufengensis]|uniref:uncharacterized protein n=1 Tax=Candida jiufengensis TaxID=497108 RepID=UPI0022248144|nr:uncharacterized protein KGF54_000718 [Candida jiufengensis]KAI5956243.1 hypothetical protein KGF54_000718 [Candida jiufengensis]